MNKINTFKKIHTILANISPKKLQFQNSDLNILNDKILDLAYNANNDTDVKVENIIKFIEKYKSNAIIDRWTITDNDKELNDFKTSKNAYRLIEFENNYADFSIVIESNSKPLDKIGNRVEIELYLRISEDVQAPIYKISLLKEWYEDFKTTCDYETFREEVTKTIFNIIRKFNIEYSMNKIL